MGTVNDIEALLSPSVREQMLEDIAANSGDEVLWWGRSSESQVHFVEAAACGNEGSVLAHFPYMERGDVVLHNHPSGDLQPSDADMQVAGELAMQGIGFYIVDNRLRAIRMVAKPVEEARQESLDLDDLSALLGPTGPLAQMSAQNNIAYEERPAQQELLRQVGAGFNGGEIVVAEGGTGIGKSFAYLLPAAFWALRNKQRVVVSTATINLQQQLIEKDIPIIRQISGLEDLHAELVKGRSNYLCRRRLKQAEEEEAAYLDELHGSAAELASISQWAAVTQDGSLSDLSFRPRSGVWEQVCGESDNCLGLRCEYHENCFIIQARRRAAAAHVLITNHHLLFADLELRDSGDLGYEKTAVLPPYRHIVLDEAHNLERNAQSFFSENLSRFSAQRSLRRLYYKRRNRQGGLWAALRPYAELEAEGDLPDILAHSQALEEALAALDEGAGVVLRQGGRNPEKNRGGGAINLRIPEDWQRLPASVCEALQKDLWPALERVRTALGNLLQALRQVHDLLEDVLEDEEQKLLLEWRQLSRRLEALRDTVLYWLDWQVADVPDVTTDPPTPERVFWLERRSIRGKEYYHRLISTQLNIGERLQKVLYKPMRTVVMVSATLTVRGSFDYWFSRVGLRNAEEPEEGQSGVRQSADSPNITGMTFRSPFDYRNRVHLLLANDAPGPSSGARYDAYVARFALKALSSMGGRSLLLFTSYAALNRCYDFLESNGALNLLRQGDDDSPRLLRRFKEEESQSLLATDSFWEGVDAPGPTLGQVILCRLPFRSPDDPIVAAHMESLELRGQNAFFHYSLPEAILRFRQGFGRLMRRTSDQGLVVVLDPRIVQKPYGKNFLESLPPTQIVCGDFEHLQRYIQTFAGEIL